MEGILKVAEQKKLATQVIEEVKTNSELESVITDPRELELRHGIAVAERAANHGQVKLYKEKLREYLGDNFIKREMELLGEEFFQVFPALETVSWSFISPELKKKVRRPLHGNDTATAKVDANTEVHFGFKIEVAPGVHIYYPVVAKDAHRVKKPFKGDNDAADYEGRMIPIAGLELVEKAKESGWFERIMVLDPMNPKDHIESIDKAREEALNNYAEMLEKDPLVFGIGLDRKPRYIYHWIGVDEQEFTQQQIQEMVSGLEDWVNTGASK